MKYDYNIYPEFNERIYRNAVKRISERHPELVKRDELTDVDSTAIQIFTDGNSDVIKVFNDSYIGAVYAQSELDLTDIDFSAK